MPVGTGRACSCDGHGWASHPPSTSTGSWTGTGSYASSGAQVHWQGEQLLADDDPTSLAGQLADVVEQSGVDALNLRVHVPGVSPTTAREQIDALGEVVAELHRSGPLRRLPPH